MSDYTFGNFGKFYGKWEKGNETNTTPPSVQTQRQTKITNPKQREGWDSASDSTRRHVRHDTIIKSFFQ